MSHDESLSHDRLFYELKHEVGNPLTLILSRMGLLQLGSRGCPLCSPLVSDTVDTIRFAVDRICALIDEHQHYFDHFKDCSFEKVLIRIVIEDSIQLCQQALSQAEVKLRVIPSWDNPVFSAEICCRRIQLSQVLVNLICNSIDAVRGFVDRWVEIEVKESENGIELAVSDSGNGIPNLVQDEIFKPYFSTKSGGSPRGLGLAIARRIVKLHHGTLKIDPTSEHTRFVVGLPRDPERKNTKNETHSQNQD